MGLERTSVIRMLLTTSPARLIRTSLFCNVEYTVNFPAHHLKEIPWGLYHEIGRTFHYWKINLEPTVYPDTSHPALLGRLVHYVLKTLSPDEHEKPTKPRIGPSLPQEHIYPVVHRLRGNGAEGIDENINRNFDGLVGSITRTDSLVIITEQVVYDGREAPGEN